MCCALLFQSDSPPDILQFMETSVHQRHANDEALTAAREVLLDFLPNLFRAMAPGVGGGFQPLLPHANKMMQTCIKVFRCVQQAASQLKALRPVPKLLKLQAGRLPQKDVLTLVERLQDAFDHGKLRTTARGQVLKVLGKIARHFPEHLSDSAADDLCRRCQVVLKQEFRTDLDKKVDDSMVAGAFKCMSCLLEGAGGALGSGTEADDDTDSMPPLRQGLVATALNRADLFGGAVGSSTAGEDEAMEEDDDEDDDTDDEGGSRPRVRRISAAAQAAWDVQRGQFFEQLKSVLTTLEHDEALRPVSITQCCSISSTVS
jgi:hypothetical protein